MKNRLKVIKADGQLEQYLHTKVIHTINNALAAVDQIDISVAEHLAEVITYYLYKKENCSTVSSQEVFSIIKAILSSTGYEQAAELLVEYNYRRNIKRSRLEVLSANLQGLYDAQQLCDPENAHEKTRWNKSVIIDDLVAKHGLDRQTARVVAAMVEEKIFNTGITKIPASLIKQFVLNDTALVLRANNQLQSA